MTRYSLRPETYRSIPERDQAPVPQLNTELEVMAACYANADRWTAYYLKNQQPEAAAITAASRDRFYSQLKPLLAQLETRCQHTGEVIVHWRLYAAATRYEPAEYEGRAECQECGEWMDSADVPAEASRKDV